MEQSISLEEVKQLVNEMVEMGLLEVSALNEKGEPLYSTTEFGKVMVSFYGDEETL